MRARVVVFAVGNPSRGDDALGPALLARLADWLESRDAAVDVELIEDFQLQIEHALDLAGRDLALFIDAGENTPAPFHFGPTLTVDRIGHSTHALEPGSVLQVYRATEGREPPPAFTLCVAGNAFELGEPLTPAAINNGEKAFAFLCDLIRQPDAAYWASQAETMAI
jgi:hydrogenase maturation protease